MDAAYPHLEGQIFEGKRFLVKMDSFIQHTPVSNHISCVPRDEKTFNFRRLFPLRSHVVPEESRTNQ